MTGAARWRQRVGFVLAFAWLHALAVVPLHAPELYALAACEVPIDLLLVFAVAVVGAAAGWPRRPRTDANPSPGWIRACRRDSARAYPS